jgi:hypothetical protein
MPDVAAHFARYRGFFLTHPNPHWSCDIQNLSMMGSLSETRAMIFAQEFESMQNQFSLSYHTHFLERQ